MLTIKGDIPVEKIDDLTFAALFQVLQSGMGLLNDLESYLRPLGMSQARLSLLLAITETEEGFVSPHEIAAITGKSRPGITRMIDKLEEDGLISVNRNYLDRRRKQLALTGRGEALLNRIVPEYNERLLALSAPFTDSEKRELIRLLGKIPL